MDPASEAERRRLVDDLIALCALPSPTGEEGAVACWVRGELEHVGLAVEEDTAHHAWTDPDTPERARAAGNLLARIPAAAAGAASAGGAAAATGATAAGAASAGGATAATGATAAGAAAAGGAPAATEGRAAPRTLLLCAHLDTVAPQAPIDPTVTEDGWVMNRHEGVLGADNKAAVAVLLAVARRLADQPAPILVELLLTVAEEDALRGVQQLGHELHATVGFVFDHATPIGELITAAPWLYRVHARFEGVAAHAGIEPERGRSAALAAAHAATKLPHGRVDPQTTANLAHLHSGVTSTTNVVPDHAELLVEVRSSDAAQAEQTVADAIDACHDGADAAGCDVHTRITRAFPGYKLRPAASPAFLAAERALTRTGHVPTRRTTAGGADANVLRDRGLDVVNVANGTERAHEPDERVSVAALEGMLDVVLALLDEAATR